MTALQDHFHPPLSLRRHWRGFYNAWATYLSSDLNRQLPEGYFAEPNVQFGIEIDVAAFEEEGGGTGGTPNAVQGSTATLTWTAPPPTQRVPLALVDEAVEVLVFGQAGGPTLAAAIELVSPANKDCSDARDAFVSKCAAYVQQGVAVMVVDVVTERQADLHAALLARVSPGERPEGRSGLYAASYRPVRSGAEPELELWYEALRLGNPLPTLPLWLPGGLSLPVELAVSYERTCREQRIPAAA